jgi:hypothetical protein
MRMRLKWVKYPVNPDSHPGVNGTSERTMEHVVLPSDKGYSHGVLDERKQQVRAGREKTVIGWGNEKPQR